MIIYGPKKGSLTILETEGSKALSRYIDEYGFPESFIECIKIKLEETEGETLPMKIKRILLKTKKYLKGISMSSDETWVKEKGGTNSTPKGLPKAESSAKITENNINQKLELCIQALFEIVQPPVCKKTICREYRIAYKTLKELGEIK